jgi:hypothetical protein
MSASNRSKKAARVGQVDALLLPLEQHHVEPPLELRDLPAQRRLRHVLALGGLRHAAGLGGGDEVAQLVELHGREPRVHNPQA